MINLNELIYYYKKKGIKDTINRIKTKYTRIVEFRINAIDLNHKINGIQVEPEYTIIKNELKVLETLRQQKNDLPREFFIDKTHNGKKFHLILLNDEPVYIHWLFGKGEYSRFCNIQDDKTIELQYGFTMPKFRGKRMVAKALNYACMDLKKNGYKRVLNVVSEGNVACIRGMEFSGLKTIARVKSYFSFNKKIKV